jgi:sigma-B regulation protein RsbU (phosphoserine phosphatase)
MTTDTSLERRLDAMAAMLRDLSSDPDPVHSINDYTKSMRGLYGDQCVISVSRRDVDEGCYRVMRLIHQDGVEVEGIESVPFAGSNAPAVCGGLLGEIIGRGHSTVIRDLDVSEDPILGAQLAPYSLMVGFPVFDDGVDWNWLFFLHTDPFGFPESDIESKFMQSNLMGGITNSKKTAHRLRVANTRIRHEIDEIANIQRLLLPTSLPKIPNLETGAVYRTYDRAGGDYYDIFPIGVNSTYATPLNHPRWGVMIADVAGHGASAAVVMAMLSTLLHGYDATHDRPGKVLDYMDQHLALKNINHTFATAFYGVIDTETRRLKYTSAGHPMPLLRTSDGSVTPLPATGGIPVGVTASESYTENEIQLAPGQQLLMYTDGITEARSPDGTMFNADGLANSFSKAEGSPDEMLESILNDMFGHIGSRKGDDDISMVLLRLK